tara:strand:+ start:87 stop:278 length:192 start_codon:yes stop_codon:yes gene_type:complete
MNKLTFADAVRLYQHDRRDNGFGYQYPIEENSAIHGQGTRQYWVLRDDIGKVACVLMNGKVFA